MVDRLQLLRNVGKFDSVIAGAQLPFGAMTVIYAENGRGKTTLAAILRSLGTGTPTAITERHRLGAPNPPNVVIHIDAGAPAIFNNGAWTRTDPNVVIFDDEFVTENVCAGTSVDPAQRQNLHELILGAQGVALSRTLQGHAAMIEQHNRDLRLLTDGVSAGARGRLSVDQFCALAANPNVAIEIEAASRRVTAAERSASIAATADIPSLTLPEFDIDALEALLAQSLSTLDAHAAAQVQTHLKKLGSGGERWIGEGVALQARLAEGSDNNCPYCAQDLAASAVIAHYRAYFSTAYAGLKGEIAGAISSLKAAHGPDQHTAYERRTREISVAREFWKDFVSLPGFIPDTAALELAWKAVRESMLAMLATKRAAPLEPLALGTDLRPLGAAYDTVSVAVLAEAEALSDFNPQIAIVKEEARTANLATLQADLIALKAVEARHGAEATACAAYLAEVTAKRTTEGLRDAARTALDNYRQNVFPAYQERVNDYLRRFNAGYRLGGVSPVNVRGGSTANYNVLIDNVTVSLSADTGPCFKNTLSAGDRNTLALAFFFSSLDSDPGLTNKVVVIDDPMSSLDEHRTLHTVQEIDLLTGHVAQVIVLSHSKPFLLNVWQSHTGPSKASLQVTRAGAGSDLANWDVNADLVTDHDRMHAAALNYLQNGNPLEQRPVAASLRPMLERFARVAYPADFRPGDMLGHFHHLSVQRLNTPRQILGPLDNAELRALLDYANFFHHDTNPAYQTQVINDAQLLDFASRTLAFITRPSH